MDLIQSRLPQATRAKTYSIRTLRTKTDLIAASRLRHEVYRDLGYIAPSPAGLELDEYDACSIPLGAFDSSTEEIIGTLRVITTTEHPEHRQLLLGALDEIGVPGLGERARGARGRLLPTLVSDQIERQVTLFNDDDLALHEMSRFIVRPEYRSANVSHGLAIFAFAHVTRRAPVVFVASCLPRHVPLYARYGFLELPHVGREYFDSVGQLASTIICRSDVLPPAVRSQVNELREAMNAGLPEHALGLSRDAHARFQLH